MALINVRTDENIEISIKRFRKEVEKENILKEVKERQYFVKPSAMNKDAKTKLAKRLKRKERKRKYQMNSM